MAKHESVLHFNDVYNPITLLTTSVIVAILLSTLMTVPVLADAPAEGVVVEGVSVPGVSLGDTRAQVEAVYGEPKHCQDVEVGGDLAWCSYQVEDGSSVSATYQGADGRFARNSPDDAVYQINWSASGWVTTAGVDRDLASEDREAVVAAYPNAEVTYDEGGNITKVEDSHLGIVVKWIKNFYMFPDTVSMAIYTPAAPLAEGSSIHVADIDVTGDKIKGRRPIIVTVSVQGEQGQPVYGATVIGTWTYPSGSTDSVKDDTSSSGYAFFGLYDASNKTWTFTIDDVLLNGHPLDRENSVLSVTFSGRDFK